MSRLGSPLRDRRSAYLLVGVLAGVVYLNALPNGFAYDDVLIVERNAAIQSLTTLPGALLTPYWPTEHGRGLGLWRPVTTAAFGLQYVLGGGAPFVFHATNVALHVGVTLLSLALFLQLLSLPAALVGALVFAVHPVHVEAVANVVGFSEILSAAALVTACLVHMRGGPVTGWGRALAVGALYAVGFGAKESGITLPGLVFLVDAARHRIGFRELGDYLARRWRVYLVMAFVAAALLAARFSVLGSVADPHPPMGAAILSELPRIWTLGEIWLHYVRLWVFPLDLASDYAPNILRVHTSWGPTNGVGVVLALSILAAALLTWRRPDLRRGADSAKALAFGVVWFVIAISPTSNTVFLAGVLLAERTLYLPSVGLAAATGWLVVRLARERPRLVRGALVVAIAASCVRTWTRSPTWDDTEAVLRQLMTDYPQSGRSQWALGDQFMRSGDPSSALRSYRIAISILDSSYQLVTDVAEMLMSNGYFRSAEGLLQLAITDSPQYPEAYRLLALARSAAGDAPETERWARKLIEMRGEGRDGEAHHLLAWALAAQGRLEEAEVERAAGERRGRAVFWQAHMYDAYLAARSADTAAIDEASRTAWGAATTDLERAIVDSVRLADFGLPAVTETPAPPADPPTPAR